MSRELQERIHHAIRHAHGLIHLDRALGNDPNRFDEALAYIDRIQNPPVETKPEPFLKRTLKRIRSLFK